MNDNPQAELILSIDNGKDTVEFIRHQDHHFWVYFNGLMTDTYYPRHDDFDKNINHIKIFRNLWFGKSLYNKTKITNFFIELVPEEFL
jgi:hypothetical protein